MCCLGISIVDSGLRCEQMTFGEHAGFLRPKRPLARHMGMAMAFGNKTSIFEHLDGT